MANYFTERQNEPKHLDYLSAQRNLYRKAKRTTAIQILLSGPLIVCISIAVLILNNKDISQLVGFQQVDISWVSAFTGVVVALVDVLIITDIVNSLKEKAATIQELFDTSVFGLPWNNVAAGSMPDYEEVNKYSRTIRESPEEFSKLKNWYSIKLDNLPIEVSIIICQRSNLCWDSELRNYFSKLMGAIALFVIFFLTAIGLYEGMTLKKFFLIVLAPSLPIVIFAIRNWIDNKRAISQLKSLKNIVNKSWDNLLTMRESKSKLMERARAVQDQIYINRKSNPLIFDWIYEKHRPRQHESMYYSIDQMINQYNYSSGK